MTFFRCMMCGSAVSQWDIEEMHGCPRCGCVRVKPSNLSLWEKLVQVIKHPKVWTWGERVIPS